MDQLLAKIGQLTLLLEGAQQRIAELEAEKAAREASEENAS